MFSQFFSNFQCTSDWLFAKDIPLVICKVILVRTTFGFACTCLLHLRKYFAAPTSNFLLNQSSALLIEGSRWILSRRQYAPNKPCALNSEVHLTTRFYGILVRLDERFLAVIMVQIWPQKPLQASSCFWETCLQTLIAAVCLCTHCHVLTIFKMLVMLTVNLCQSSRMEHKIHFQRVSFQ